jgi:hypothetical protein
VVWEGGIAAMNNVFVVICFVSYEGGMVEEVFAQRKDAEKLAMELNNRYETLSTTYIVEEHVVRK